MHENNDRHLDQLSQKIGYTFKRKGLLKEALTHRSYNICHYERLEFLGDSVLNCAVSGIIFQRFVDLPEGDLSRIRANLVNQKALYEIASVLNLGDLIRFGDGEIKSGGKQRPSILADALEAVIGAVYLDGKFAAAERVVKTLYTPVLRELDPDDMPSKDPKTLLQEYLQRRRLALPAYSIVATIGKAHNAQFKVACSVPKFNIRTIGEGGSRRSAEQQAAKHAYEQVCAVAD